MYIRFHNDSGTPSFQVFAGAAPVESWVDSDFYFNSDLKTPLVERFSTSVSSGSSGTFNLSRTYANPPVIAAAVTSGGVAYGARNYRSYDAAREAQGYPWQWFWGHVSNTIWATATTSQISWGVVGFSGTLTVIAIIVPGCN